MFSSFAGVCFAVKSKSTGKHLLLTGKSFRKFRKMVYENFFRKPFLKMRSALSSLLILCSFSLLSLSTFSQLSLSVAPDPDPTRRLMRSVSSRAAQWDSRTLPRLKPTRTGLRSKLPQIGTRREPVCSCSCSRSPRTSVLVLVLVPLSDMLVRQEPVLLMSVMICGF
jgi:hypothetical protein